MGIMGWTDKGPQRAEGGIQANADPGRVARRPMWDYLPAPVGSAANRHARPPAAWSTAGRPVRSPAGRYARPPAAGWAPTRRGPTRLDGPGSELGP